MIATLFQLFVLWLCLGMAIVQVVLAVRARRVEREEGLPRSKYRLLAVLAVCLLVGLFVVWSTVSAFRPAPPPDSKQVAQTNKPSDSTPTKPELDEVALKEIQRLEKQRAERRKELEEIDKKIEKLKGEPTSDKQPDGDAKSSTETTSGPASHFDFLPIAIFLVPFLLLLGLCLLFFLGDPGVLLRLNLFGMQRDQGELRTRAVANLNGMAAAANEGRFREGLSLADAQDANLLDRFDRLDWAYLKSYCAVQLAADPTVNHDETRRLLDTAVRTLTTLLEEAPNRGEAAYLLAMAQSLLGQSQLGLDSFTKSKDLLPAYLDLPFAHNQSVNLLNLAEEKLSQGDTEGSSSLFDRVTRLQVLVDKIPSSLVKIRLLNVRKNLQANNLTEATQGLQAVRNLKGLDETQRQNVTIICDALQALICVRGGDDAQIAHQVNAFLEAHVPSKLPIPDEAIADEYLDSPLAGIELQIAPQIYRAFFFLKAEVAARLAARGGRSLTAAQVDEIAKPLLRALQFELRQRDVLAALGALTYWFVPEKRPAALHWLEAAVEMGVESRIARRLLERSRQIEVENREALEWFRSTAGRFLHDPTVSTQVRHALVEELGRFQGFQPLLLGLDLENDLEPPEATLSLVRERAGYLDKMVADFTVRKSGDIDPELDQLRKDYAGLIGTLAASMGQMVDVERRMVQAIGKTVLS